MSGKLRKKQTVTRRQFLKEASLVVGGAAIASLALTSACSSPGNGGTTSNTGTTTTTSTPATTTNTTTSTPTSLPPSEDFIYSTPSERPPLMPIPGCTTFTATDRLYIVEHMWIKLVAENIVVIGITEKMSELMDKIYSLYLPEIDHKLTKEGYFGYGEAAKLNVEFISPVSGTVRQINNELFIDIEMHVNKLDGYDRAKQSRGTGCTANASRIYRSQC